MKLIVVLLACCLAGFASPRQNGQSLSVSISTTKTEHSRDSNTTSTSIRIVGNDLTYEEQRRRSKPSHKEYKLTENEIAGLKSLITEKKLLASNTVEFPSVSGPHTDYESTAEIRIEGKTATLSVSGPINSDKMKSDPIYQNTQALLDAINHIMEKKDSEPESRNK